MHVGIANSQWRGKLSRHSRCMRNPQFCVSGKRPMISTRCETPDHQLLRNLDTGKYRLRVAQSIKFHRRIDREMPRRLSNSRSIKPCQKRPRGFLREVFYRLMNGVELAVCVCAGSLHMVTKSCCTWTVDVGLTFTRPHSGESLRCLLGESRWAMQIHIHNGGYSIKTLKWMG